MADGGFVIDEIFDPTPYLAKGKPRTFALTQADYAAIGKSFDALEAQALSELGAAVKDAVANLSRQVRAKDADLAALATKQHLFDAPAIADAVRALLQRAWDAGQGAVRKEFAFDPDQPRDEQGRWTDAGIRQGADAIAKMDPHKRDNTEIGDFPGGPDAYSLYEARKMLPKPSEKLKRVSDSNSFNLYQEYDYIANVGGIHFGISKNEDPDEPDDESKFIYSFKRLDTAGYHMRDTTTADTQELFTEMRKHLTEEKRHASYAAAPTYTPRAAATWLNTRAFYVTGVLDDQLTNAVRGILVNGLKTGKLGTDLVTSIAEALVPYVGGKVQEKMFTAHRLETIVRTNTTEAYNKARLVEIQADDRRGLIVGVRYSAILDERTTPVCRYLDGKVFEPDNPDLEDLIPPLHFRCRSIIVPVGTDEDVGLDEWITEVEIAHARTLADASFLSALGVWKVYREQPLGDLQ